MFQNERGFTLIEVLVAMCILLVGLIGSLMGTMAALDCNLGHSLGEEAAKIAQEELEVARNSNYAALADGNSTSNVQRQFRKAQRTFQVVRNIQTTGTLKSIVVSVTWNFKKRNHTYTLQTIRRQPV